MASGWLGLTGPNFLPVPQRSIWSQNERMTTHLAGGGGRDEGPKQFGTEITSEGSGETEVLVHSTAISACLLRS